MIYFYHDMELPLFVLDAYAKNVQADLSPAECRKLQRATKQIVEAHQRWRSKR